MGCEYRGCQGSAEGTAVKTIDPPFTPSLFARRKVMKSQEKRSNFDFI